MRKSISSLSGCIEGVKVWDWTQNPIQAFHLFESCVYLFEKHKTLKTWENRNERPESPQDYVVAFSDSARYIGRAYSWYKKTEDGLVCLSEPIPEDELDVWQQLDLGSVPQSVAAMTENYHAGHISVWVSTLVDVLEIKDFPSNMFAREEALRFTKDGTLLFTWGCHTRSFKPINPRSYRNSGWEGVVVNPSFPRGLAYDSAKEYPRPKSVKPAA